jgi:hypothetical protein
MRGRSQPGLGAQTTRTQRGRARMDEIQCTSRHVAELVIESDRRVADVETVTDATRGIFKRLFATATTRFAVTTWVRPSTSANTTARAGPSSSPRRCGESALAQAAFRIHPTRRAGETDTKTQVVGRADPERLCHLAGS